MNGTPQIQDSKGGLIRQKAPGLFVRALEAEGV